MKRSEALYVIINRLIKQFGANDHNKKLADLILCELEDSGLKPPLIKIPTTDIYGKPFFNFKNEWEPEDA